MHANCLHRQTQRDARTEWYRFHIKDSDVFYLFFFLTGEERGVSMRQDLDDGDLKSVKGYGVISYNGG